MSYRCMWYITILTQNQKPNRRYPKKSKLIIK